jgi:hypothetical protein
MTFCSCSRPYGRESLVFNITISQSMHHRCIPRLWRGGYKNLNPDTPSMGRGIRTNLNLDEVLQDVSSISSNLDFRTPRSSFKPSPVRAEIW